MTAPARPPDRRAPPWEAVARRVVTRLRAGGPASVDEARGLLRALHDRPPTAAWHPTGFVVLEPFSDEAGSLRLHLWPASEREHGRPCWPVHDHAWHLRSQVLCGVVCSHGYAVEDDPAGDAVLYAVQYGRDRRSCMRRSPRRVRVRARAPQRVEAGGRYHVDAGAFHASHVDDGDWAATLVVTQRTDRAHPWVVGPVDGPERVRVVRPRVDGVHVGAMLERVAAALA